MATQTLPQGDVTLTVTQNLYNAFQKEGILKGISKKTRSGVYLAMSVPQAEKLKDGMPRIAILPGNPQARRFFRLYASMVADMIDAQLSQVAATSAKEMAAHKKPKAKRVRKPRPTITVALSAPDLESEIDESDPEDEA